MEYKLQDSVLIVNTIEPDTISKDLWLAIGQIEHVSEPRFNGKVSVRLKVTELRHPELFTSRVVPCYVLNVKKLYNKWERQEGGVIL
jgi:hypothetical protein